MATRWSETPESHRSLNRGVKDGMGQAVLNGVVDNYMAAYAVLLGLTASQVAIASAFPGWIGSFIQVAGAWLARRGFRRKTLIVAGCAVQIGALPAVLILAYLAMLPICAVGLGWGRRFAWLRGRGLRSISHVWVRKSSGADFGGAGVDGGGC